VWRGVILTDLILRCRPLAPYGTIHQSASEHCKVGIVFLALASKRPLLLSRREERVIDGNIGQNRGRGPRGGDSDETGRHSVVRQGNSKRFLAKNSQKVALGEGGGRYQRDTKTGSASEQALKKNLPNTIDRRRSPTVD
jgi:hypothetical protein